MKSISSPAGLVLLSAAALIVCLALLWGGGRGEHYPQSRAPLLVFCASGLKGPIEAIRSNYERQASQRIQIQYGGSATLLANLKVSGQGDIFLPADASYIELAQRDALLGQTAAIARMRAIVAVRKGNPHNIRSLDDLLSGRIKISMTEPDAAATGKLTRDALQKTGRWDEFKRHVTVFKPTVNDVASDLQLGAVDAAVIWDAMLVNFPDFEEARLAELPNVEAQVVAAVTSCSRQPEAATAFLQYLSGSEGRRRFQEGGFTAVPESRKGSGVQP